MNNDKKLKELVFDLALQVDQNAYDEPLSNETCKAIDALVAHIKLNY